MATIDSLQDSVNTLTSSTTALLDEVNVSKATLTNSKDLAETAATSATTQAANAASSASAASSSASSASSSASAASASAASASAIVTGVATGMPSVRPSLNLDFVNSKTVDPRISFTRSTTATYYDGKTTAKAEENLVRKSSSPFSGANNAAITVNSAVAPDGTTTATKVEHNGTDTGYGYSLFGVLKSNEEHIFSLYVKQGTVDSATIGITIQGVIGLDATFTFSTKTFSSVGSGLTPSYQELADGWFRLSLAYTPTGGGNTSNILRARLNASYSSGDYVYAWGPQVEQRDSLTAYTPTTTSPITNYIPVLQTAAINEPRLDHDPVTGEAKGLLIEESRTNLRSLSNTFGSFVKVNSALEADVAISPEGTLVADKFVANTSNTAHQLAHYLPSLPSDSIHTVSMFVKPTHSDYTKIDVLTGTAWGNPQAKFDLVAGTAYETSGTCTGATIEDVGNGWHRISMSFDPTTYTLGSYIYMQLRTTAGAASFVGNDFDGLFMAGYQLEVGSFPTSYIPTSGASVSRTSDRAYMTDVSWVSPYKGTFICEAVGVTAATGPASSYFEINNGSSASRINAYDNINDTTTYYEFRVNGVAKISPSLSNTGDKIAFSYDTTAINVAQTGATYSNATLEGGYQGFVPTQLLIGDIYNGQSYKTNGTIKNLKYYPENLSASEIAVATDA